MHETCNVRGLRLIISSSRALVLIRAESCMGSNDIFINAITIELHSVIRPCCMLSKILYKTSRKISLEFEHC